LALAGPAVAAAALLLPCGAEAAPHGGGGAHAGGGGHAAGSFHAGSFHGSTFHGNTFHAATFHGNTFHGNTFHAATFHGNTFNHHHGGFGVGVFVGPYYGYGYRYGYPYGGGYYSYGGGYYPSYTANYYAAPYVAPAADYYTAPLYGPAPDYGVPADPGAGGQPPPDLTAHVEVRAPADAEIWFGDGKTRQTGTVRSFVSPSLTPGKDYTYEVRARWTEGGKEVVQTRRIDVAAGAWKSVDFTKPAAEAVDSPKPAKP
jgi:uncharacterized protein (TIGR03000 family)